MSSFWLGCLLGALFAAVVAAPLVAPWSIRVRYLVNAPATDPWTGLTLMPRLEMCMVEVTAVECRRGHVDVVVDEICGRWRTCIALAGVACAPAALARLDGWMATRTHVLMITERGEVSLSGPDGLASNLRAVDGPRRRYDSLRPTQS